MFTHKEYEIEPEPETPPPPPAPPAEPEEEEKEPINWGFWIGLLVKGGINAATIPVLLADLGVTLGYMGLAIFSNWNINDNFLYEFGYWTGTNNE